MRFTTSPLTTPPGVRRTLMAALAIMVPITFAGSVTASGAATDHASKGVTVSTLKTSTYGTILVSGSTVYTLKPSKVACTAKCLKIWPEVLLPTGIKKATAGLGVKASKLGTIARARGQLQVTYAGKPLYWFSKDFGPGQIKGNVTDTWGTWSVVVTVKINGGIPTTTSGGAGGGIGF